MAKKQTRRSVSIRGTTYDRIRSYCERNGLSMSELVEELISRFFSGDSNSTRPIKPNGKSVRTAATKPKTKRKKGEKLDFDEMQEAARHFTF